MSLLRSFGGWAALGIVLGAASVAQGQTTACVFRGADSTPPIECMRAECDGTAACPTFFGPGATCDELAIGGTEEMLCRAPCGTLFGCGEASDCPRIADSTGACVPLDAPLSSATPRVCVYPAVQVTYCPDPTTPAADLVSGHFLKTCHTTPESTPTSNYFLGDCDGDGCPNGADMTPCVAGEDACGVVSIGGDCAPPSETDAGVALPDGGNVQDDAGVSDAGAADAGVTAEDDAGPSAMDGSTTPPVSFHGGGGCTCSAGSRAAPRAALALGMLALLVLRRRRR